MVKKMMRTRSRKIQLQRGSQRKNGVLLVGARNTMAALLNSLEDGGEDDERKIETFKIKRQ